MIDLFSVIKIKLIVYLHITSTRKLKMNTKVQALSTWVFLSSFFVEVRSCKLLCYVKW